MTGDPRQDNSQAGYAPIYIYDSLTITITDPDLTPKSIITTGNVSVGGALSVKGISTLSGDTSVGGALSVTDISTLSGNTSVGGALSVAGRLTVQTNALTVVNGNVGIGTINPSGLLQVAGGDLVLSLKGGSGQVQKDLLVNTLRMGTQEDGSYGVGIRALQPAGNWSDGVRLDLCTAKWNNEPIIPRLSIMPFTGNVGIGTTNPEKKLHVEGDLKITGGISCGGKIGIKSANYDNAYLSIHKQGWPSSGYYVDVRQHFQGDEQFTLEMACSRDFKENINELTVREALTTLAKLNPIKYDYKDEKAFRQNLGFIAEEMPDNLASFDKRSISPFEVIPILTKVVQEQQRTIVKLESLVKSVLQVGSP